MGEYNIAQYPMLYASWSHDPMANFVRRVRSPVYCLFREVPGVILQQLLLIEA